MGALGFILEEKIMSTQKKLDPVLIVGIEGLLGVLMWMIALTVFQFLPCSSDTFCCGGRLENTYTAFLDYGANSLLIWQSVAIMIIIPFSSICGITTAKIGSSSQRISILLFRNIVVWVFFLTVPLTYTE